MKRAGFSLDLGRCTGCGACVLACRLENRWPEGVHWRRVLPVNLARWAGGPTYHLSVACHHCQKPACLTACPAGAYDKRADGIVWLDADRCIGCRYCQMACPFGAPSFDSGSGIMTKCHMCSQRIAEGGGPACVSACPTDALKLFEDAGTPEVPGFHDPADCDPSIRFRTPRGRARLERFQWLVRAMRP